MPKREFSVNRRRFAGLCAQGMVAVATFLAGCAAPFRPRVDLSCDQPNRDVAEEFDFIVVGSGAGGGPLAANLARRGYRVLLLEAGDDTEDATYRIPLFHALASENPEMRWDFFVRHYESEEASRRDPKFVPEQDGVLYPRCSTLGGCTAHNAMIFMYPHNDDWDQIAAVTGDRSWSAERMRAYFERIENCQYADPADKPARHGFAGWLPVSLPSVDTVLSVFRDDQLRHMLFGSVSVALKQRLGDPWQLLKTRFDPNDWRRVLRRSEGLCAVPLTTYRGRRTGPREYVRETVNACGGRLAIRLNTLVTRVLLEDSDRGDLSGRARKRAVGVVYRQGRKLYRADRAAQAAGSWKEGVVKARREVILAGGAFNTPQLLMLSGIGPGAHLREQGIAVQVDLPGVGENLQDRYELGIVSEMKEDFSMLRGVNFTVPGPDDPPNPYYDEWQDGEGIFTSNGAVVSFMKRSTPDQTDPDLVVFGMPGYFAGYYPGYSARTIADQRHFTWAILKARTKNTAGVVRLKSGDPCEPPYVNFRYFGEGNDRRREDLDALVKGVEFVRSITQSRGMRKHVAREVVPGPAVKTRSQIEDFAQAHAWGHHASCSCRMGHRDDPMAVVDSRFRVHGVEGLRIVDASIFPRIPGYFIVGAVYMIAEKATDCIDEDARHAGRPRHGPATAVGADHARYA